MVIQPDRFMQAGNASWISMTSAWGLGFFLPLIGFFYLRNAIAFDEKVGVSQLITSAPVKNWRYFCSKLLSATLQLYCFAAVVILGSFFMTLWRFAGEGLSVQSFLTPYLYLIFALPFIAALAVFFESLRWLRGVVGSVIFVIGYFLLYSVVSVERATPLFVKFFELSGFSTINQAMATAVLEQSGRPMDIMMILGGMEIFSQPTAQLYFNGVQHTASDYLGFIGKLVITGLLVLLAAALYNPIKETSKSSPSSLGDTEQSTKIAAQTSYSPVTPTRGGGLIRFLAELRLTLAGQPLWWMIISGLAIIASFFVNMQIVENYVIPLVMLWFIGVFSAMGSREYQDDILKIIGTVPNGRFRQIIASWLSGLLLAIVIVSPILVRSLISGGVVIAFAAFAGAVFVPSLALFCGELTRTRRAFELGFIVMTYFVINKVPTFMYLGLHSCPNPGSTTLCHDYVSGQQALVYLLTGLILGSAAVFKRMLSKP